MIALTRLKAAGALVAAALLLVLAQRVLSAPATEPAPVAAASTGAASGAAVVVELQGPIGPATSHYVERGLEKAARDGAALVVLQLDTPGGLDSSMRDIISAILASPVPVATYVAPSGARAASAGTYILYASHIAAMAPATNVGASTPVAIGGQPPATPTPTPAPTAKPPMGDTPTNSSPTAEDRPTPAPEPGTAMERKTVNDAVAYLRGLAELRGRNADWAEETVRRAASLSSQAALDQNVIDIVASDLPDLLAQIHGREVSVLNQSVTLASRNLTIERVSPDWRTRVLSVLTNPTIAYGLLLIGLYGLLLEGYNPGALVPGVVGAIALILALYAFQILDVNWAGLALMGLGAGMIIAEFFVPSFGALGLGGVIAFVVGSIILLDTDVPGLGIAWPLIAAIATGGAAGVAGVAWLAARSMRRPVVSGTESMVGSEAVAYQDFTDSGQVYYGGELWNARTSGPIQAHQRLRIVRVDGLTLWVEPLQSQRS
ncbi:MAG: nodulation protein NfeD [Steroidobacteraceae bacterium]